MAETYSTYEAKAKFSEVMRKVRSGARVVIAYRGEAVAEIAPIGRGKETLQDRLQRLQQQGIVSAGRRLTGGLKPLARKRGALARFLESRE